MGCDVAQMQCSGNSLHLFGVLRIRSRQCQIWAVRLGFVFDLSFYELFAVFCSSLSLFPFHGNGVQVEVGLAPLRGRLHEHRTFRRFRSEDQDCCRDRANMPATRRVGLVE